MTDIEYKHDTIARDDAAGRRVRDVMVRRPKTLPVGASVAELREHFTNPRVQTALLADGGRFAGAIAPSELPDDAPATDPALRYTRVDVPTLGPDATMADALALMDSRGDHRLVVLDGDGDGATLVGLLCLDRTGAGFCTEVPAQAP
jgi:CBS domain-containing protein